MILTPTASADQFIQAVGRGSRRNSQGLTEFRLVVTFPKHLPDVSPGATGSSGGTSSDPLLRFYDAL